MIRMRTWDDARAGKRPRRHANFEGFITDFIETADSRSVVAQAYLVEQNPNWVTPPHFHVEHQFQVVTAGSWAIVSNRGAPFRECRLKQILGALGATGL